MAQRSKIQVYQNLAAQKENIHCKAEITLPTSSWSYFLKLKVEIDKDNWISSVVVAATINTR